MDSDAINKYLQHADDRQSSFEQNLRTSGGGSAVSTVCSSLNDMYNAKDWNDDPIKAIATSLNIQIPTTLELDALKQKRDELQKEKERLEKEQKQ
ncbi:unnamed protein product [Didymodactylos carnosus]|uniref:Uncharacterized protein n=1 Tax=Didymodactylos carnosus TaxID=1234261 RepID=A0A814C7E8_9BILA|nr:unnamed protein product [Didymodactylos carnosus]CAF1278509.1 unnamed protein product [Didymodactylos carnosus]CAF3713556.1 unnamed protein product [Didymodactylos carnosus]CAF4083359.1 unnamed protein product [Didymodactylos carnosus]